MDFVFFYNICPDAISRFLKQSQKLRKLSCHTENEEFPHANPERLRKLAQYSQVMQTISSRLDSNWTFYIVDPYENPFHSFTHVRYIFERIID